MGWNYNCNPGKWCEWRRKSKKRNFIFLKKRKQESICVHVVATVLYVIGLTCVIHVEEKELITVWSIMLSGPWSIIYGSPVKLACRVGFVVTWIWLPSWFPVRFFMGFYIPSPSWASTWSMPAGISSIWLLRRIPSIMMGFLPDGGVTYFSISTGLPALVLCFIASIPQIPVCLLVELVLCHAIIMTRVSLSLNAAPVSLSLSFIPFSPKLTILYPMAIPTGDGFLAGDRILVCKGNISNVRGLFPGSWHIRQRCCWMNMVGYASCKLSLCATLYLLMLKRINIRCTGLLRDYPSPLGIHSSSVSLTSSRLGCRHSWLLIIIIFEPPPCVLVNFVATLT